MYHSPVVVDVDMKTKKIEWKLKGQKRNAAKLRDEPYIQFLQCSVR